MRIWLMLLAGFAGLEMARAQQTVDGVAAVVNREIVTLSEVRKQVDPTEREFRDLYQGKELVEKIKETRLGALNGLIDRLLIVQEFKSMGFQITDKNIDERVASIVKDQYGGKGEDFIKTLNKNDVTLDEFKKEIFDELAVGVMREKMISGTMRARNMDPAKAEARQLVQDEWLASLRSKAFIKTFF